MPRPAQATLARRCEPADTHMRVVAPAHCTRTARRDPCVPAPPRARGCLLEGGARERTCKKPPTLGVCSIPAGGTSSSRAPRVASAAALAGRRRRALRRARLRPSLRACSRACPPPPPRRRIRIWTSPTRSKEKVVHLFIITTYYITTGDSSDCRCAKRMFDMWSAGAQQLPHGEHGFWF